MKKINFLNTYRILSLLLAVTFLAAMSGCRTGPSSNQPVVNRPTPTLKEESPTATPSNPSTAFVGEWETNDPRASSGGFVRWKFGDGTKKDNGYTGKVTDMANNDDIANYTITEKTITLEYLPPSSGSKTYDYKITDEGKTISLQGDKPWVLRKGTNNAEMEKAAETISKYEWNLDSAVATKMGLVGVHRHRDDFLDVKAKGDAEAVAVALEQPRARNRGREVLGVAIVVLHQRNSVLHANARHEHRSHPVMDEAVRHVDLLRPVAGLQPLDDDARLLEAPEHFGAPVLRQRIDPQKV